jgi:hypothetical protein
MRYRLRTLLIVLALGPVLGAWGYREVERIAEERRRRHALSELGKVAIPGPNESFPDEGSWNPTYPDIDGDY